VVPNLGGAISGENLELDTVKGYLKVDENYETSESGIYADR